MKPSVILILIFILLLFVGDLKAAKITDTSIIRKKDDPLGGLKAVNDTYGHEIAKWVERIFRHETRHFQSEGYRKTLAAGMETFGAYYPWGWSTPASTVWQNKVLRPTGTVKMVDSGNSLKEFIVFPSTKAAMLATASIVAKYGAGRWFSVIPERQQQYVSLLLKVNTPLSDSLIV